MNTQKVKDLEEKEITAMNRIKSCRDQKAEIRLDQMFKLGLINIKIGNYQKARDLIIGPAGDNH